MSAITTSVGLISGIPIEDTVNQLISVARQPLNRLATRTQGLQAEQTAVDTLATLVLGLQASLNAFKSAATFTKKTATSSDAAVVAATVEAGKSPKAGAYQFTPIQTAAAHRLLSGGFADLTSGLGDGSLSFRFGGHVDKGIALSELNGGAGFKAGKIKITDRAGNSAQIDLRGALSVDDVLAAINGAAEINVRASIDGDTFVLTDEVGGAGNLAVQEVGLGKTAASLGLAGLSVAADAAVGADVFRLNGGTRLSTLNDGAGVRVLNDLETVDDLTITLRDETTAGVDLSGATTLQGVIDAINNDADLVDKVTASISADGARLVLTDLTTGAGELTVSSVGVGRAAEGLGLDGDSAGGVLTGRRLVAGLRDTLVSSLNGGRGFDLADINVTDRAGNPTVNVDLSSAETLSDVVRLINDSGANVKAAINSARNGIEIADTSGGTGSLVIANGSSGSTASDLAIAVNGEVESVNSGGLNRQTVAESTLLSSLNGGAGITIGDVRITDSSGAKGLLDLNKIGAEAKTVGDVIDAINALNNGVEARINDAGDGVLITDTAGGSGKLTVADINGATAAGLGILGVASETDDEGRQVLSGSTAYSVDLSDLTSDVNSLPLSSIKGGAGVDAGVFQVIASNDAADSPKRFTVNLADVATVGQLLDKINDAAAKAGAAVTAQVTSSGTGIELIDTAGGPGSLTVKDLGTGTAAADLGIAGAATAANAQGEQRRVGFGLFDADAAEAGALELAAKRINDLEAGVTASVVFDGVGYRLALDADKAGAANELLIDDPAGLFGFEEVSRPRDAVLLFGASASSAGIAVSSTTNNFEGVVDGLSLAVKAESTEPVTVTVARDNAPITTAVANFVKAYNSIRTNLDNVTAFDAEANTTGILFGRNEALGVDTTLGRIVSGSFAVGGVFSSLQSIGVSLDDEGVLSVDNAALADALAENAADVERLLGDDAHGLLSKFTAAIDQLANDENSLLSSRSQSLQRTIDANNDRLATMNESVERQRNRLLLEFYRLEETIAGFQSNIDLLDKIQYIAPVSSTNR